MADAKKINATGSETPASIQLSRTEMLIAKIESKELDSGNSLEEIYRIRKNDHPRGCKGDWNCTCGKARIVAWSRNKLIRRCACSGWASNVTLTFDDQDIREGDWTRCPFCNEPFKIRI